MILKHSKPKELLLIVTTFICSINVHAQINDKLVIKAKPLKTDRELNNLIGKVKTFKEEFFVNDKDVGFKRYYSYFSDEYQQFDENGLAVCKKYFDKSGNIIHRKTIEYDALGKIKHVIEFDTTNNINNKLAYVYNDLGQLTQTIAEEGSTNPFTTKYSYTTSNNLLNKEELSVDGKIIKTTSYEYDAVGNKKVIDTTYSSIGGRYKSKVELYDANENMLEQTRFDDKLEIVSKYEYSFDKNNNNIEFKSYSHGGVLQGVFIYKFDDKNNMIEESKFNVSKNLKDSLIYEYKYDSQGNWTEKITKHQSIPKNIVKRNIQYYP
jgi:hypothetical protein